VGQFGVAIGDLMLLGKVVNFLHKESLWLVKGTLQSGELTADIFEHSCWY